MVFNKKDKKTRAINRGGREFVQSEPQVKLHDPTRKLQRNGPVIQDPPRGLSEEPETKFFRPGHKQLDEKPVVGWLVVIAGPGQGKALDLGDGHNDIGRSVEARVSLNFGDEGISRKSHAILTYDPRSHKFTIRQGDSANMTYIDDAALLDSKELSGGETIELGQTTLKFVALCGPDFDWADQA